MRADPILKSDRLFARLQKVRMKTISTATRSPTEERNKATASGERPAHFFPEEDFCADRPVRTLWYLYRNNRPKLLLALLVYVIKHSPEWIRPIAIAGAIDVIAAPDIYPLSDLWLYGSILGISIAQNVPTHYLYAWLMSAVMRDLEMQLRLAIARQLQYLSLGFYYQQRAGALQSKLLRDVEAIQNLTRNLWQSLPSAAITIGIAIAVTAARSPWFLLFFAATIPIAATFIILFRVPIHQRNERFRREIESLSARFAETIKLVPVTRAHAIEEAELARLSEHLEAVKQSARSLDALHAIFSSSSWAILRLFNGACLLLGAWLVYTDRFGLSVGDVVLFNGYFETLAGSVVQIAAIFPQIGKGLEAMHSVGEILEARDFEQNRGKQAIALVRGEVIFESVSYTYPGSQTPALRDFSLKVMPGETIAIVGASGAGKSTLMQLIVGFLRPSSGRLLLDGRDINELDMRTYRRFVAVVAQETILFSGTVRENVLYGCPEIDEEQLRQVARDANALEFIDALPEGFETKIGENGAKLSGGQRQRLAIARAFIRHPNVLILDEATASLDTASEASVQEALERLQRDRTTFIVAHRFSTLRHADRIVVLEKGSIAEVGDREQLLANNGIYSQLDALQI